MHSLNSNKAKYLMDYQSNCNIDLSLLTETWFQDEENYQTSFIREFGNYNIFNNPRITDTWGGGVCVLAGANLVTKRARMQSYVSFEIVAITLTVSRPKNCKLKIICLYRKDKVAFSLFCEEFTALLNDLFLVSSPILIAGDFNIAWNAQDSYKTKKFKTILLDYGLYSGHIPTCSTQKEGNTIDLIICDEQCQSFIQDVHVDQNYSPLLSDHFPVLFSLKLIPTNRKLVSSKNKRRLNKIDYDQFMIELFDKIHSAPITHIDNSVNETTSLSNMVSVFNKSLSETLDNHAPVYECSIKHTIRPTWLDHEYVLARAERRRLERICKRTNSPSDIIKYEIQRDYCIELVDSKRNNFYSNRIFQAKGNQKVLFNTFTEVCDYKAKAKTLPESSSDIECATSFNNFFVNKVQSIHKSIAKSSNHLLGISENKDYLQYTAITSLENYSVLSSFEPCTILEISTLLGEYSIKNSPSDPVPSPVLLNCCKSVEFLTYITELVNVSLKTGSMDGLKNAVVSPLLKKLPNLDENEMKSYRPVSQLPFLSKIIERVVLHRLNKHMIINDLNKEFQHGYKKQHSTETLLLKFLNDLIVGIDQKLGVVVLLIDLSAAFDTVNHNILLNILAKELNISGVALRWFQSFLSHRSQQVKINDELSDSIILECGVAQGSVLGPVLYNIYSRSVKKTFTGCGFACLAFADDKNGYMLFSLSCEYDIFKTKVPECLEQVQSWASEHLLKLNKEKTEILVFGNTAFLKNLTIHGVFTDINEKSCIRFAESAKYLGVWLDTHLTFDVHVSNLLSSGYAKLRKIRTYRKHLSKEDTEILVHAFITSKLDNCNSLLVGVNSKLLRKVQKLQNAAIRTVYQLPIRSSVSNCYKELHWLNVEQRITFKIILFVFKAINGKSPNSISVLIHIKDPVRMTVKENLFFPKSVLGRRAFCYLGPRYWNILPNDIRQCIHIDKFKGLLKSHLLLHYQDFKNKLDAKRSV